MRCLSCNTIMTQEEESRTYDNGDVIGLCSDCFDEADIYFKDEEDDLYR